MEKDNKKWQRTLFLYKEFVFSPCFQKPQKGISFTKSMCHTPKKIVKKLITNLFPQKKKKCIYTHIYTHISVCIHVYWYADVYTHVCKLVFIKARLSFTKKKKISKMYIHPYWYTDVHTRVCTCVYTDTSTNVHKIHTVFVFFWFFLLLLFYFENKTK